MFYVNVGYNHWTLRYDDQLIDSIRVLKCGEQSAEKVLESDTGKCIEEIKKASNLLRKKKGTCNLLWGNIGCTLHSACATLKNLCYAWMVR